MKERKGEERKGKEKGRDKEKELAFIESILDANCFSCCLSLTLRVTYTSSEIIYLIRGQRSEIPLPDERLSYPC